MTDQSTTTMTAAASDAPKAPDRLPGHYGIDAPYVPAIMAVGAVVSAGLAATSTGSNRAWWAVWAIVLLSSVGSYLYATFRGKFVLWREITDDLGLRGDEQILDVGCGRGMAMLTVAGALTDGRATGIDLWRSQDQSGNDTAAAEANAAAVGVTDRVEFQTADMAELPFPDASFDVVVANVSIQNIKDRARRRTVIDEIVRVTKPGGRVRIADIQYVGQYRDDLEADGLGDATVRNLGIRGWFGNPFYATRLVSATKPR